MELEPEEDETKDPDQPASSRDVPYGRPSETRLRPEREKHTRHNKACISADTNTSSSLHFMNEFKTSR